MKTHNDLKQLGLVTLIKNENGDVFKKKGQFDPETGERLDDVEEHIDVAELIREKAKLEDRLAEITGLLSEIEAIPVIPEVAPEILKDK